MYVATYYNAVGVFEHFDISNIIINFHTLLVHSKSYYEHIYIIIFT